MCLSFGRSLGHPFFLFTKLNYIINQRNNQPAVTAERREGGASAAQWQRGGSAVAAARKRDVVHGIGVGVHEVATVPRLRSQIVHRRNAAAIRDGGSRRVHDRRGVEARDRPGTTSSDPTR